jgi:Cu(I)/Ag(I) efflux system membrane fusion protein
VSTNTKILPVVLALAAALGIAAGSYWLGARSQGAAPAHAADAAQAPPPAVNKPLYYRNPMGLADTSPVPKKDEMGMDYIPVYAEDAEPAASSGAATLRISTEKVQKLGVRSEAAALRVMERTLRAAGRVEADERRIAVVAPKFEGYVERLHVNATGQFVAKGQVLFEAYSPELLAAQREYLLAAKGVQAMQQAGSDAQTGMQQLAESALARLRNWDLGAAHLAALQKTGDVQRTLSFASPVSGIVTEKKAQQGMRFMAGETLYQITDLSSVWVVAEVFEQDLALLKTGATAAVSLDAYANRRFPGRIAYVYPTLKAENRTVPVRVELANPGGLMKPGMFAQVELGVGSKTPVLAVPESAVIATGSRNIVLVQLKEGRFEPRELELGARAQDYVEVRKGLREGELVVTSANFLIDAESNLKAAVQGMGAPASAAAH